MWPGLPSGVQRAAAGPLNTLIAGAAAIGQCSASGAGPSERALDSQHVGRVRRIVDLLDDAADPQKLKIPGLFLHPLKGDRKGQWAVSVSGNWRITLAFDGEDVIVVNLEDYR